MESHRGSVLVGSCLAHKYQTKVEVMEGENTLAYYSMAVIMAMKSCIVLACGALAQCYKSFMAAMYEN